MRRRAPIGHKRPVQLSGTYGSERQVSDHEATVATRSHVCVDSWMGPQSRVPITRSGLPCPPPPPAPDLAVPASAVANPNDAALSHGAGASCHLAGTAGGWRRGERTRSHRAGIPPLPRMRHPRPRFRPRPLRRLWARLPDCRLLQMQRSLPILRHPAQGRDRRTSGRTCHPASASAAVGALGAQAPALSPGTRFSGTERRTAHLSERHRACATATQSRCQCSVPPRHRDFHPPLR